MPSFTRASYSRQSVDAEHQAALIDVRGSSAKAPLGPWRTLGSAVSIILGITLCYAGLHYIPTLLRPSQVIDSFVSPSQKSILDIDRNRFQRFGVYAQSFLLRRTYLRAGQGIEVHYSIPEGASLDLHIKQCRRMFIGEVFHCIPVSQQTVRIENKTHGTRALKFAEPGFYHFDETVNLKSPDQPFKLVWVRN
ncbi:MAG: hypothetical protein ACSHX3_13045 [Litorimonas sp.]